MAPKPTCFKHTLLIFLLLLLLAVLPLSASAAGNGMISASSDHVDEGNYISLSTNMTGTITWTSSNSSLATVSSNGLVYGKQAGQVTITASCAGYTDATFTLWVTVPDGVYYLKNASSGLCMEAVLETAYVYTQSTNSTGRISQLWQISYVSNGNYIIRPFGDYSLAMTVGDSGLVTVEKDASAFSSIYWQIVHNAFGYAFKHGGSNAKTAMPTVNGPTGVPVHPSDWSSSLTCHWELEKIYGVFLRDTNTQKVLTSSVVKSVELGNAPVTLSDLGLSWEHYGNLSSLAWYSSNESVATVNSSGSITSIEPGETAITISAAVYGTMYTQQIQLQVESYVIFYAIPDDGHDHFTVLNTVKTNMQNANFSSVFIRDQQISNAAICKNDLLSARIFTSRSHGYVAVDNPGTAIILQSASASAPQVSFHSHYFSSMSSSDSYINVDDDFSNLLLVLFVGCETGAGGVGGYNLPTAIVAQGATTAIGFAPRINCEAANEWTKIFYQRLLSGSTVEEAVSDACTFSTTDIKIALEDVVICGNKYLRIC